MIIKFGKFIPSVIGIIFIWWKKKKRKEQMALESIVIATNHNFLFTVYRLQ